MVRASAKNFLRVASVTDPSDYGMVLSELRERRGSISLETRFNLARKAFACTARYDKAISGYLAGTDFSDIKGCYKM